MPFVVYPLLGAKGLKQSREDWFPEIQRRFSDVPERQIALDALVGAIVDLKKVVDETVHVVFICTHNSRRSQLAQVWAQCIADDLGIDFVRCHSAGTEQTSFHPNAIQALEDRGFVVKQLDGKSVESHAVYGANPAHPLHCFSKTLEAEALPKQDFIAVTTCDEADRGCPFIPGAFRRIALPYSDPKISDGTPAARTTYTERSSEIALEMLYVLGQIAVIQ